MATARRDPAEVERRIDAFATAHAAGKTQELTGPELGALDRVLVDAIRGADDVEVPGRYVRLPRLRDLLNAKIRAIGQGGVRGGRG
jgi:hypothetical protein